MAKPSKPATRTAVEVYAGLGILLSTGSAELVPGTNSIWVRGALDPKKQPLDVQARLRDLNWAMDKNGEWWIYTMAKDLL